MRILLEGTGENLYGFKYFWAKHVRGFNNERHCAKCLLGGYEKLIRATMPLGVWLDIPVSADVLYICGVSQPYRWANNFHLAVKNGGNRIEKTLYNGVKITLEGVEEVYFDGEKAAERYPNLGEEFLTCRNFQFGVSFYE
jgi:hypothetical protein